MPYKFQSTPPSGGDTRNVTIRRHEGMISIHAPLGGRHQIWLGCQLVSTCDFNPRPPRGATQMKT